MLYIERKVENNEEYNNIYISIVNYNLTKKCSCSTTGKPIISRTKT